MSGTDALMNILKAKPLALDEDKLIKLCRYYELLLEGNKRMNLTAITSAEEAADKHFVDSLLAMPFIPKGARCIDVGTGAGMPGIPLMIARDDIEMTLLDSLNKRVRFLEETTQALGLNATCIHSRAEELGSNPAHREKYDIALSRAVAPLNVLLELTLPFVRQGGASLCYKGKAANDEALAAMSAAKVLGAKLEIVPVDADYGERYIIIAKKLEKTPAKYPRKPGEPNRHPL